MSRVIVIAASACVLAACSSGADFFRSSPASSTLQFESEPQGAEVKLSSGQACRTPCALAVPEADMSATFALTGYQPQTVPVRVLPPEPRMDAESTGTPGARFMPNPVYAELVKAAPPPRKPAPPPKRQAAKKPPASVAPQMVDDGAPPPPPARSAQPAARSAPPPAATQWPPAPNPVR